jgi:hypothetical protein
VKLCTVYDDDVSIHTMLGLVHTLPVSVQPDKVAVTLPFVGVHAIGL